jgi:hypothetical protein
MTLSEAVGIVRQIIKHNEESTATAHAPLNRRELDALQKVIDAAIAATFPSRRMRT